MDRVSAQDTAGIRFHPPILHAIGFGLGWIAGAFLSWPIAAPAFRGVRLGVGVALIALGLSIALWAALEMRRARTGIPVHHPVTALVTSGPFAWSRNPIYLALNCAYLGATALLNSYWPILFLAPVVNALERLVIAREERFLTTKFGDAYRSYAGRVRRWL